MCHAVLCFRLRNWQFVIARQFHLAVLSYPENGVCAPCSGITRSATWCAAATPFVSEDDDVAVIIEGGRMPVGKVGIRDFGNSGRVLWIRDIQQDAVSGACTTGESNTGVCCDVMALVGHTRTLGPFTVVTTLPEAS